MAQVVSWDIKQWREQLKKRLESCKRTRASFESQWVKNRSIVYNEQAETSSDMFNLTFDNVIELESGEVDAGDSQNGTNYAWKFVRFRHGQFSANPPAVIARPTSSDHNDRASALAADKLIRHDYADGDVQELFDQQLLKALVDGTGWIKQVWDPDRGDVFDFNAENSEIIMEGDIYSYSPSTMDIYIDPLAKTFAEVRFIFEAIRLPLDEALFRFPDSEEVIRKSLVARGQAKDNVRAQEDIILIYEYYEKGMPINGLQGRRAYCLEDGTPLKIFARNTMPKAKLPYYLLTDVDVEDVVYGKSNIEYVARKQELLNRFDSAAVDALTAHGVIRLIVPESSELNDDEISNSNYDIVRFSGAIPPSYMTPPALPPDIAKLREQMRADIQDLMGINDSQMGVQKREQSGFSQQTAIESGNTTNRRFFNKFSKCVKEFWRDRLELIRDNWSLPRIILVLGKENAFDAAPIKGADIAGGFDIAVDYGTSLPLDPNMRREQIMLLMQPLQQAGIPMQRILKMLRLNELDAMYDELEQGEQRQREIFDEMVALYSKGEETYIPPEELENHESMLMFCQRYRMSMEYKILPPECQTLIQHHIKDRMAMAAQVKSAGSADASTPGIAAPGPGVLAAGPQGPAPAPAGASPAGPPPT